MGYFLQELKRRNVFRVGAAYAVAGWLIIQVIETISGPLGLPEWTEAFFIVLVLAGLPIVLLFAWAFELTPEGLKKTKEVDRDESVTADTGKKLNYAIIAVLVAALGYFIWERQGLVEAPAEGSIAEASSPDSHEPSGAHAASVAVLPFVNMSADPEQEYFSDGISEELLNLLAKIPDLRVPARTSSFQFKGRNLDIADVAEQLNVAHVLEGSVRKADVRIRVTAQLIEAETGYHLWSETYDRELTDIFAIQDEISASIVDALSDTLGIKAEAAPHVKAAANPEAYNAYLLGQHLIQQRTKGDIEAAIPNFEHAIEMDPTYAPAHANLGLAWYLLTASRPTYGTLTLEESLGKALPYVETALQLDPELAEAHGVMGLTLDARQRHEEALPYYEEAIRLNPSYIEVRSWYASVLATLGRDAETLEVMEKAYEIDPLSVLTLHNYTNELVVRRQFDRVRPVLDRLAQLDSSRAAMFRSFILSSEGKAAEAAETLFRGVDSNPGDLRTRGNAAFSLLSFGLEDDALLVWPYPNILPIISNGFDSDYALELAKQQFEGDPTDLDNVESLAWAYWNVGEKDQALKMARRYRGSLGDMRAPIDGINRMFALDAWQKDDEQEMLKYLLPLQKFVDSRMASGVDMIFINYNKATQEYLQGNADSARQYFEKAMSIGLMLPSRLDETYETLGWNDLPEFVALREQHEAYRQREKARFLQVACGPDGFSSWQPSPDVCSSINSI